MSEPTPNKPKVTLEELLRLKRHERPPAEYWVRFDRELNERVWRTLAEPAESKRNLWLGWIGRQTRWLAAGAIPVLLLALVWQENVPLPLKLATRERPVQANVPAIAPASVDSSSNNAQALAAVAENNIPEDAQPTLVAAKNLDSTNPAGFHKVPAMLDFAASEGDGVRYASDTFSNPANSARIRGSAY
jgi:hypothetical protein